MSISGSQSLHGLGLGDSLAHETSPFSQSNSSLATGSANFNGMTDGQTALSTGRSVTNSSHLPYTMSPNPSYSMQANAGAATSSQVVPVGFEEGTLRALCDLDCGFPLLMDRTKQSMASCRVRCALDIAKARLNTGHCAGDVTGGIDLLEETGCYRRRVRKSSTEAITRAQRSV